jgi:MFS family permease
MIKIYTLLGLIYFIQGLGGLAGQSLELWMKNIAKIPYGTIEQLVGITAIPWFIKPLYGFLSDTFPIFGYRRVSYLILNYIALAVVLSILGLWSLNIAALIILLTVMQLSIAFNDVVCDGLMVETGKKYNNINKLQSIQWICLGLAGIFASYFGGLISQYGTYQQAYCILAIVTVIALAVIKFMHCDVKVVRTNGQNIKNNLKKLFTNKKLLFAWLFLICLYFSPACGSIFRNVIERDKLHFSESFIGILGTVGAISSIVGYLLFNKFCAKEKFKKLLTYAIIGSAITSVAYLWYPNASVAIVYAILFSVFGGFCQLAILGFVAILTPKNLEGLTFATTCALLNLSGALSHVTGGALYKIVGLPTLIILSGVTTLACIFFIPYLNSESDYE